MSTLKARILPRYHHLAYLASGIISYLGMRLTSGIVDNHGVWDLWINIVLDSRQELHATNCGTIIDERVVAELRVNRDYNGFCATRRRKCHI
jgi:hypothetical protein